VTGPADGEIILVVLDTIPVTCQGIAFERVIVRGAYPRGGSLPAPLDGAVRNIVQTPYGRTTGVRALLIPSAEEER